MPKEIIIALVVPVVLYLVFIIGYFLDKKK
jgi:uncharacterized protein YneF (UPF0154 family)